MRSACLVLLGACGRIAIEPTADGGVGDGATGDGSPAELLPCLPNVDLVACFSFDGAVVDQTPNHHDATTISGVTYVAGRNGLALALGSSSDVELPHANGLDVTDTVTLEVLVRVDTAPAPGARSIIVDHNLQYSAFVLPGGEVGCSVSINQARQPLSVTGLALGTWTWLVCSYNGARETMWLDGIQVASMPLTGTVDPTNDGIRLGGNIPDPISASDDRLIGALDQLRIWRIERLPN